MEAPVQGVLTAGAKVVLLGEPLGYEGWVRVRDADGQEGCVSARYIEVTGEAAASPVGALNAESDLEARRQELEEARLEEERARAAAEQEAFEETEQTRMAALEERKDAGQYTQRRVGGGRSVSGFLELSAGMAWAAEEEMVWNTHIEPNQGGGVTDDNISYHNDSDIAFAIGGGVIWEDFGMGVGLRLTQQTHEGQADIDLFRTFAVPPFQIAASARTASDLAREERAAHVSFIYTAIRGDQFQLRLLVGPTYYFDVTQETVDRVITANNPPRITGFVQGEQDDSTVGFHLGADASWYWGRFGVGLSALYSQGEVEFEDRHAAGFPGPAPEGFAREEVDVGGVQAMAGLRLRL